MLSTQGISAADMEHDCMLISQISTALKSTPTGFAANAARQET
jgi:hypothetical protein